MGSLSGSQTNRATTNISRLRCWAEKANSQKWNYNLGHKMRTHHFYEKGSDKMFLECYKDQEKWSHYEATINIYRPRFLAGKAESQKRNYILDHKMRTRYFY